MPEKLSYSPIIINFSATNNYFRAAAHNSIKLEWNKEYKRTYQKYDNM